MTTNARDTLATLIADLKAKLATPGQSLLPLLATMGRFPQYSLGNQFAIFVQCPHATRVMGFRSWLAAGYAVRKGEKGIAIYAPMRLREHDADLDRPVVDHGTRLLFRVVYVFDRSQVEPLASTATSAATAPLAAPAEASAIHAAPLCCLEQLKLVLLDMNLVLDYRPMRPGAYGCTDGVRITCATGLSPAAEFTTLAHEATHASLHFGPDRPDLTTRETEAEAVAYLLATQCGLPDTDVSIDYIRAYRGTPETLESSLERIRTTAAELTAALNAIAFTSLP